MRRCVLVCPLAGEPAAACVALGEVLCCASARSLAGRVGVPQAYNWLQAQPRNGLHRLEVRLPNACCCLLGKVTCVFWIASLVLEWSYVLNGPAAVVVFCQALHSPT